jgi:hypothetical protein
MRIVRAEHDEYPIRILCGEMSANTCNASEGGITGNAGIRLNAFQLLSNQVCEPLFFCHHSRCGSRTERNRITNKQADIQRGPSQVSGGCA